MQPMFMAVNDWRAEVNKTLQNALNVSMNVVGRTGEQACKHALILMAQSAAAITPKAPARRPVNSNPKFRHLLRKNESGSTYKEARMAGRDMAAYYKFSAFRLNQPPRDPTQLLANTKKGIGTIAKSRRGLAKRSWMWGLGQLGASEGRPIAGTFRAFTVHAAGGKQIGYGKENKLSYVTKIMPSNWDITVASKAANKIMKQAAIKIGSEFVSAVQSGNTARATELAPFFKAVT